MRAFTDQIILKRRPPIKGFPKMLVRCKRVGSPSLREPTAAQLVLLSRAAPRFFMAVSA